MSKRDSEPERSRPSSGLSSPINRGPNLASASAGQAGSPGPAPAAHPAHNGNGWSGSRGKFNPKSRFNPARNFVAPANGANSNSVNSNSGSGGSQPHTPASAPESAASSAPGTPGPARGRDTPEPKKFNPTSMFSPKRGARPGSAASLGSSSASLGANMSANMSASMGSSGSANSANASAGSQTPRGPGLMANGLNGPLGGAMGHLSVGPGGPGGPGGPVGGPVGPGRPLGSGGGAETGVFSDLVPKFSPVLAEYSQMYQPPLHPLNYHLYAPPPFRVRPALDSQQRLAEDLFASAHTREELQSRNDATLQVLAASSLPEFVHVYHSLVPLDAHVSSAATFGYPTWRYKAVSNTDGRTYCLLRLEGFHLTSEQSLAPINKWRRIKAAGVVGVVEAFTTLAFGDHSLVVVYEFFPLALPLSDAYRAPLPEGLLWGLAAQLVAAVQQVHKAGLAARLVDAERILVTQKDRLRLGSCGALDIVSKDSDVPVLQRQDWQGVGKVLKGLACLAAPTASSDDAVPAKYSADFANLVKLLLDSDGDAFAAASAALAPHMWRVLDGALFHNDNLERELSLELENGRLVRLLAKINFVLNWPDHASDPRYQPTGDRYPLVLFRDYVFHQNTEQGQPSLDLAHAIAALNKLDAGIDENVLLISPNEETRIIVSYKELKHAFEQAFRQLRD